MTSKTDAPPAGLVAALQEALARESFLKERTLFLAQSLQEAKAALAEADARAARAEEALKTSPRDGE